jgi:hypothetical protein
VVCVQWFGILKRLGKTRMKVLVLAEVFAVGAMGWRHVCSFSDIFGRKGRDTILRAGKSESSKFTSHSRTAVAPGVAVRVNDSHLVEEHCSVLILVRWLRVRKPCTRSYRQGQALLKSDSLYEAQKNSEIRNTHMHRKVKVLVARWLASHIESHTRRLRRALRDHQRGELRRIRAADRRARGLRLYAAWSCKEKEPMNFRTVVPLQPSSAVGKQAVRNVA